MKDSEIMFFVLCLALSSTLFFNAESRAVQSKFYSDAIVTHWPTPSTIVDKGEVADNEENQPGFMRRQLIKFGQVASRVGNAMGTHATKITLAIDKICEVIKTIVPLLAAVCHVGQFKFCAAATEAPSQLSEAISTNNLDLNIPDR